MSDTENTSTPRTQPVEGTDVVQDQDSEPTLNAPEADRPDGLVALDDDESDSTGGDGNPS